MRTRFNSFRWNKFNGVMPAIAVICGVVCWSSAVLQAKSPTGEPPTGEPPTGELPAAKPLSAVLRAMPDLPTEIADEPVKIGDARLAKTTGLSVSNVLRGGEEQLAAPPETELLLLRSPHIDQPDDTVQSPQIVTLASRVEILPVDAEQAKLWIVEAHELGTQATTESQFTRVIELCDKATATELTSEIRTYTRNLAAWAYNRRGKQRADAGQDEDALADFIAAVRRDPEHWKAIHNRGVSYAQSGKLKEAFDDFCHTIELRPNHAKAYSNRGALYEQSGDLAAALDDYRRAIEIDPALAFAHAGRGRASHRLHRLDVAKDELNEAIRLTPDNAAFYTSRADLFAEMGDYGAALSDYGRAIELNPVLAEAYRNGAWLLATCPDEQFRNTENAIIGAEKAIELAGGERHLYLDTLAAAQANAGDFDSAVQTAEYATENAPEAYRAFFETRLDMYKVRKPFRTK